MRSSSSKSIITKNAITKARTTFCSSLPLLRLRLVGDLASAVENVLAAYSDTTVAPHEYFDQTGLIEGSRRPSALAYTFACFVFLGHIADIYVARGPVT
jgi:hypothetical protein